MSLLHLQAWIGISGAALAANQSRIALLINVGIFFTPLVDGPTSRGELMLFALPDAVVVLAASIASYRVNDVHQRATRQTMILGLIVALVFCVGLFAVTLTQVHNAHGESVSR